VNIDICKTTVVFDLDDTLYQEVDYVDSGVRCVCGHIKRLYGLDLYPLVKEALALNPKTDWLAFTCSHAALLAETKESLLWMYRLHEPNIRLSDACLLALQQIKATASAVAVLTDGRSITQRLKLKALGLDGWPAYISEDYGAPKPSPQRFKAVEDHFRSQHYVYVADNIKKDFVGCNPRGWISVGMKGSHRYVHRQAETGQPDLAQPTYWANSWKELTDLLIQK